MLGVSLLWSSRAAFASWCVSRRSARLGSSRAHASPLLLAFLERAIAALSCDHPDVTRAVFAFLAELTAVAIAPQKGSQLSGARRGLVVVVVVAHAPAASASGDRRRRRGSRRGRSGGGSERHRRRRRTAAGAAARRARRRARRRPAAALHARDRHGAAPSAPSRCARRARNAGRGPAHATREPGARGALALGPRAVCANARSSQHKAAFADALLSEATELSSACDEFAAACRRRKRWLK